MVKSNSGIILIDKAEGHTSFEVVKTVKRVTGAKKVGHAGTLDPFATGLLIVMLEEGTKLSPYIMKGRKEYIGTVRLGAETDTLDLTGKVIEEGPVPNLSNAYIKEILSDFTGEIEQVPPGYSALKYKGRPAYSFARKGIKVELKKRTVTIFNLEIIGMDLPDITLGISCSGGTYIRSLAADIGRAMGTVAHLISLRRISSGSFKVKDAIKWNPSASFFGSADIERGIISLKDAVPEIPAASIDEETAKRVRNGYQLGWDDLEKENDFRDTQDSMLKVVNGSSLIAILDTGIGKAKNEKLKILRVFY